MSGNVTVRTPATPAFGAAVAAWVCLATAAAAQTVSPQAVGCKMIRNAAQLQAMQNNLAGNYCLANDIDASSIANFVPIGDANAPFKGRLFGNGRVIRNLKIDTDKGSVGFFGAIDGAVIQNVGLVNADVVGRANSLVGGLAGYVIGSQTSEISGVHVSGRIVAKTGLSYAGGIVGNAKKMTLTDSWSSASVSGGANTGGAAGVVATAVISRVYATGPVACVQGCLAGGLLGFAFDTTVDLSYAAGRAASGDNAIAGGLVAVAYNSTIKRSHALGAVVTESGYAGGLVGSQELGAITEVYSIGRVTGGAGAIVGGLVGKSAGMTVSYAYWDLVTSGQLASAAGAGYTTAQLRKVLQPGFGNAWAITPKRSYPFLNDADIDFAAPLATLINRGSVFTFLPIDQHDKAQYAASPANADAYALATVYTMIARGIGVTGSVAALKGIKIDRFWNDTKKMSAWRGQVTSLATLGALRTIAANTRLNNANVIGEMKNGKLVILRGTYTKSNGVKAEHWMLGTLYTASNGVDAVVANDPWTGLQVTLDPATKKVVWPSNYPLTGFKIDGYRPVTLEQLE